MVEPQRTSRQWLIETGSEDVRIRCSYERVGKQIVRFTVQLEIVVDGNWVPVVRYDNAHGFCHRDTLHPDGSQDKTPLFPGDANDTFTTGVEELKASWQVHQARYLGELHR
jgi:hypothetical protein